MTNELDVIEKGLKGDGVCRLAGLAALVTVRENVAALTQELADLNGTFDLRHAADMRAIGLWREGHPDRELCQPDQADLIIWLMEREIALTQERDEARVFAATMEKALLEARTEEVSESDDAYGDPAYWMDKAEVAEARVTQLEEIIGEFVRHSEPLAAYAQSQWADDNGLSQPCHWLNVTRNEARAALSAPAEPPKPQPEAPLSPGERSATLAVLEPFAALAAVLDQESWHSQMFKIRKEYIKSAHAFHARLSASPADPAGVEQPVISELKCRRCGGTGLLEVEDLGYRSQCPKCHGGPSLRLSASPEPKCE